jgi:hypothetical protein
MCEKVTDSRVTPSAAGSHQELLKLDGRQLRKHEYIAYTTLRPAKDGIGAHLFPLTLKSQSDYRFHLIGREVMTSSISTSAQKTKMILAGKAMPISMSSPINP